MPLYAVPLVYESYANDAADAQAEAADFAAEHMDIGYIGNAVEVTADLDDDIRYKAATVEIADAPDNPQ